MNAQCLNWMFKPELLECIVFTEPYAKLWYIKRWILFIIMVF